MNNSLLRKHTFLEQILDSGAAFYEGNNGIVLAISLCLLAVVGVSLFLWATAPHGIGIRTDSVAYLWSAKDLAQGIGLGTVDAFGKLRPLNQFPPFYPILLAAFELLGISGLDAARWIGALFVVLQILISGLILARLTNRAFWLTIIGVLVLFYFPAVWETNLYAMTEPLFIVFSLTGLLCLDQYYLNKNSGWLWLASVLFGLSFLTRYIGIAVIVAGALFILDQKKISSKRKDLDLLIMASISVLPMIAWLIRNTLLTGSATDRGLNFVPITPTEWILTFQSIMTWITPVRAAIKPSLPSLVIFLIAIVVSFLILRRKEGISEKPKTQLPLLIFICAVAYILLTIAARLWADPTIPLNEDRILYPFLGPLFFLALYGIYRLIGTVRARSIVLAAFLSGICMVVAWGFIRSNSSITFPYISPALHSHVDGLGLQYRTFLGDKFEKTVAGLPEGDIFFTDNNEELYFFTERVSSYIGDLTPSSIKLLQEQFSKQEVVVIFFDLSPKAQQILLRQDPQLKLIYRDYLGRFIYLATFTVADCGNLVNPCVNNYKRELDLIGSLYF